MKAIKKRSIGLNDKAGVRGRISWIVYGHTSKGLQRIKQIGERLLNSEITKYVHDFAMQAILNDPECSFVKTTGESLSHERLVNRGFINNLRWMLGFNHNIVTNQGDALIADQMSETPTQTKVDNANGYITVGTGWTGTTPKTNEAVNTPATGSPTQGMESTYPKQKGAFGAADDNVTQYRTIFAAGELNDTGIDEAGLGNHATEASGDNLAYAEISPTVDVSTSDTLQTDWELTFLGA